MVVLHPRLALRLLPCRESQSSRTRCTSVGRTCVCAPCPFLFWGTVRPCKQICTHTHTPSPPPLPPLSLLPPSLLPPSPSLPGRHHLRFTHLSRSLLSSVTRLQHASTSAMATVSSDLEESLRTYMTPALSSTRVTSPACHLFAAITWTSFPRRRGSAAPPSERRRGTGRRRTCCGRCASGRTACTAPTPTATIAARVRASARRTCAPSHPLSDRKSMTAMPSELRLPPEPMLSSFQCDSTRRACASRRHARKMSSSEVHCLSRLASKGKSVVSTSSAGTTCAPRCCSRSRASSWSRGTASDEFSAGGACPSSSSSAAALPASAAPSRCRRFGALSFPPAEGGEEGRGEDARRLPPPSSPPPPRSRRVAPQHDAALVDVDAVEDELRLGRARGALLAVHLPERQVDPVGEGRRHALDDDGICHGSEEIARAMCSGRGAAGGGRRARRARRRSARRGRRARSWRRRR